MFLEFEGVLLMDDWFVMLVDDFSSHFVDDWFVDFMYNFFLDHRLNVFVDYVLMVFMNHIFMLFNDDILMLLMNYVSVGLFYNRLLHVSNHIISYCMLLDISNKLFLFNNRLLNMFLDHSLGYFSSSDFLDITSITSKITWSNDVFGVIDLVIIDLGFCSDLSTLLILVESFHVILGTCYLLLLYDFLVEILLIFHHDA